MRITRLHDAPRKTKIARPVGAAAPHSCTKTTTVLTTETTSTALRDEATGRLGDVGERTVRYTF
jgi:hypothetical protein